MSHYSFTTDSPSLITIISIIVIIIIIPQEKSLFWMIINHH